MMNPARHVLVGIGEVLWDMLPGGRQLGGAPANFAYHAHALGADAHVVSCVGNDDLGRELVARLAARGMDCSSIEVDSYHPTGTVDVKLDFNGKPAYVIHENVAWDNIPLTPTLLNLARRTDAVCFGSLCQRAPLSRNTIREFIDATPKSCVRLFDVNIRQSFYDRSVMQELLRRSTALKISDDELPVVCGLLNLRGDPMSMLRLLLEEHELSIVALTRGARGSVLISRDGVFDHPGCPAEVVDTVGAGDAFSAAMAMGLLAKLDCARINDIANRLAAYVCSHAGAMPAIPDAFRTMFT